MNILQGFAELDPEAQILHCSVCIIIIIVIIMIMIIIIITSTQTVDHSHSRFVGIRCRFLEQKSLNAVGQLHSWDSKRPQGSMCIADFLDA